MKLRRLLLAVGLLAALLMAAPAAQAAPIDGVGTVQFSTVPPIKGLLLRFPNGETARTDSRGTASVRLRGQTTPPRRNPDAFTRVGERYYAAPEVRTLKRADGSLVRFDRRYGGSQISLKEYYRFAPRFVRQGGSPVPPGIVESYTLKSRTGEIKTIEGTDSVMLQGTRVVPFTGTLVSKDIEWALQSVKVDGTNVVTRARNRFSPRRLRGQLEVPLLFFSAKISSTDAIFGSPIGHSVTLTYPNGRKRIVQLSKNGESNLPGLPRGNFTIKANASGVSPERPLALSRDQVVDLKVISYLDLGLVAALLGAIAILLLVVRRPNLRKLKRRAASHPGAETAGTADREPAVAAEPTAPERAAPAPAAPQPAAAFTLAQPAAPQPAAAFTLVVAAIPDPAVAEPAETRPALRTPAGALFGVVALVLMVARDLLVRERERLDSRASNQADG